MFYMYLCLDFRFLETSPCIWVCMRYNFHLSLFWEWCYLDYTSCSEVYYFLYCSFGFSWKCGVEVFGLSLLESSYAWIRCLECIVLLICTSLEHVCTESSGLVELVSSSGEFQYGCCRLLFHLLWFWEHLLKQILSFYFEQLFFLCCLKFFRVNPSANKQFANKYSREQPLQKWINTVI